MEHLVIISLTNTIYGNLIGLLEESRAKEIQFKQVTV